MEKGQCEIGEAKEACIVEMDSMRGNVVVWVIEATMSFPVLRLTLISSRDSRLGKDSLRKEDKVESSAEDWKERSRTGEQSIPIGSFRCVP